MGSSEEEMLAGLRAARLSRVRPISVAPARDRHLEGMFDLTINTGARNSTSVLVNPLELRAWGEQMIAAADKIERGER